MINIYWIYCSLYLLQPFFLKNIWFPQTVHYSTSAWKPFVSSLNVLQNVIFFYNLPNSMEIYKSKPFPMQNFIFLPYHLQYAICLFCTDWASYQSCAFPDVSNWSFSCRGINRPIICSGFPQRVSRLVQGTKTFIQCSGLWIFNSQLKSPGEDVTYQHCFYPYPLETHTIPVW